MMKTPDIEDDLFQILKINNLSDEYRHFTFHHMGIATNDIESTFEDYQNILYVKGDYYVDEKMGVRGLFALNDTMPNLEILENLSDSHSLDVYLKYFMTVFHQAYIVDDFEYCFNMLVNQLKCKIISEIYNSSFFKGKCCYILTPDRNTLELIEDKR